VALLLLTAVGTTVAYLVAGPEAVENTFTPSRVSCVVVENGGEPVSGALVNTGDSKNDVQIKNTGDTAAYIRATVVVNWTDADGTKIWANKPVEGTDYNIVYNLSDDGWVKGSDGFYYYSKAVSPTSPDNLTSILIKEAKLMDGVTPPTGADDMQYYLSIEVVASAIQATSAAVDQWSNGVATASSDGAALSVKTQ
jgi:hypothetical protein